MNRPAVEELDLQVCRAIGVLRVQAIDQRDVVLVVRGIFPKIDIGIGSLDRHSDIAKSSQLELVIVSACIVVRQFETRSASVVVDGGEGCERVEVLRVARKILHGTRLFRYGPSELV